MDMLPTAFFLTLIGIVQGCSLLSHNRIDPLKPSGVVPSIKSPPCPDNISYLNKINQSSSKLQKLEIRRLDQALSREHNQCAIIQLAIFLASPGSGYQNYSKAINLFNKFLTSPNSNERDKLFAKSILPLLEQTESLVNTIKIIDSEIKQYKLTPILSK